MIQYPVTKPYFTEEESAAVAEALNSGWVAQGPRVAEFERQIARHEGVAEGVATTSCTTALHLAMVALGLGPGMDAIAPSFTFVATANAIVETGATPILTDVDPRTFNIDIRKLEKLIAERYAPREGKYYNRETGNLLWGIVPVHEFGLCCDIESVNRIAREHGLLVLEDAACSLGTMLHGKHEGAFGNMSCISFHPRKSITTGEGGMILTDDAALARRMRELRTHGSTVSADARDKGKGFLLPEFNEAGFNYRMTDIQAAVGLAQVKKLDWIIQQKRIYADRYTALIREHLPEFIPPFEPEGYFHTWQSYVCMLNLEALGLSDPEAGGQFRNELLAELEDLGIATRQGTHAVHLLGYYKNRFGYRPEDIPGAWACDRLSITLPLYIGISEEDQEHIIRTFRNLLDRKEGRIHG